MPVEFDTAGMEQYDERTWFCPRTGDQVSLTYIDLVPDLPAPLDDLPLLRRRLALETADVGALIEAHVVTVDSVPTLYQLLKLPIPDQESGQAFIAAFTMPKATCSVVLRIQCAEGGPDTGLRESAVIAELGPEAFLRPHPYAPELDGRLPWHLGDHQRYDEQFPEHPLSRARAWANKTVQTARVDSGFAQLPPFEPERGNSGGWTIPPTEPKPAEPKPEPKPAEKRSSGAHARVERDEPKKRSSGAHARKTRGGAHALADDAPAAARTSGEWPKPSEVPVERPPAVPGDDETAMERTMLQAPTLGTPARGTPSVGASSADRTRGEPPSESLLESLSGKGSADSPRPEPPRRTAPPPGRRRAKKSESPAARSRSAANAERRAKSAAADTSASGPLARQSPPARSTGQKGSAAGGANRSKSTPSVPPPVPPPGTQGRPGSTSQPLPTSGAKGRPASTSQPLPTSGAQGRSGSTSQPLPTSGAKSRPGSTSQPLPTSGAKGRPASTSQPLPAPGSPAAARAASQPLSAPPVGSPERPFLPDTKPGAAKGPVSPAADDPPRQFPVSRIVTPDGITAMELTSPHSMSPLGPMRHKTDPPPMGSRTVMPPVAERPDPPAYPGGGPLGLPRSQPAGQSQRIVPDPNALPHPAAQSQRIVPVDPNALPHPAAQSQRIVPVDPNALPHPAAQSQRIVPVDPNAKPHPAAQSQRIVPIDPHALPAAQSQRMVPVDPNAMPHPAAQSQRMVPVDPNSLTRPVNPGAGAVDPSRGAPGFPPPGYPTDLAVPAGYPGGPADPAAAPAIGPGAAGPNGFPGGPPSTGPGGQPAGFPVDLGGAPTIAGGYSAPNGQPPAGYPVDLGGAPTIGGGQLPGAYPGQPNSMGPNGYATPDLGGPSAQPAPGAPPANGYATPGASPPSPPNGYPMSPANLAGAPAGYPMAPPDAMSAPVVPPHPMGAQPVGGPPAGPSDAMHTVLIGLPIGGYLPLWHDRSVSYWRMLDPGITRTRLGLGVESRTEIDHKRFREAAMFSPDRNTLFLMDRYRDPSGNLGGTSTQLVPATEGEAFRAATDKAMADLYGWLGDVVVAAGERGEYVAVETGGWAVPVTPVVLIMLRTDGREWHSVVETSPVPSGAPVWRDQQPVVGDTQLLASPATERTMRAAGLLTRFAVATWPLHPFQLGLSFGPNPTLGDFGTR